MDPVSVFRALYDSKCIKFGQFKLKPDEAAPYHINLRCLPLCPQLTEAVVEQVVEKFLSPPALKAVMNQIRRQEQQRKGFEPEGKHSHHEVKSTNSQESDADSQLEEEEIESCSEEGCEEQPIVPAFRPIISGRAHGAVPLAAAIAYKARLPFLLLDSDPDVVDDNEDDGQRAENQQQSVILIDEVIGSGESTLKAVRAIEKLGLRVEFVICIVDREENGVSLLLEQQGIRVFSLYNMIAILRVLEATGRITAGVFTSTRQWISNNQFESIGLCRVAEKCIAHGQPEDSSKSPSQRKIELLSN